MFPNLVRDIFADARCSANFKQDKLQENHALTHHNQNTENKAKNLVKPRQKQYITDKYQ